MNGKDRSVADKAFCFWLVTNEGESTAGGQGIPKGDDGSLDNPM
jgi:hypothetical protein